ncbi:TatD family hydrolase [Desulfothermobacter acidiphilus]|uniref:TatD family hydrolase n=1 Tax=Desulfothermobacter acidiphilus TaxID=1938353 RepID=UPI003F8BFE88
MTLIDTHCHLNDPRLYQDWQGVLRRAQRVGVKVILVVGYDLTSSARAVELAAAEPSLYAAVGVHPHDAATASANYLERLRDWAREKKVVALGEIGLDYYRNLAPPARQREVFLAQYCLARELGLPVVLHCRDAYEELYQLLRSEAPAGEGVVHCFSGDWPAAEKLLQLGFHLSFTGVITFPRNQQLVEVVARTPIDRLLLETDAPYLAPVPYRGRLNEPAYLPLIARKVAEIKRMEVEEVAAQTTANAYRLFAFKE